MKWLHYPNGISVLVQYENLYTILCKPFLISASVSVNAPLEEEEMLMPTTQVSFCLIWLRNFCAHDKHMWL